MEEKQMTLFEVTQYENLSTDFFMLKETNSAESVVAEILKDVKMRGDNAVRQYSEKFDNIGEKKFRLNRQEIENAYSKVDQDFIEALKFAKRNIQMFAEEQKKMFKDLEIQTDYGVVGHRIIPLNRVACYIPGGRYALPSTALMTIVPAKVAGVKEILVTSPKIKAETIVAADIAGADSIFRIGGAQAIGAFAYGTESVPKVDKIVGPGNKYVTMAKKQVFGIVGIDMIAGPSEVMVVADRSANPKYIAADLLAQAEHDVEAIPIFVALDKELAQEVVEELKQQLEILPTRETAKMAIKNGMTILVSNRMQAVDIINKKAPEHLEIMVSEKDWLISNVTNYGSLFIGNKSAEVFGDYCSGPNHTLPTNGAARFTGGLSVKDFLKMQTFQQIEETNKLIEPTMKLAEVEGLFGHLNAARIRKSE